MGTLRIEYWRLRWYNNANNYERFIMESMSFQEIIIWYQNLVSANRYLVLNMLLIIFSFFSGKICAIFMGPKLTGKKYSEMIVLLKDEQDKLRAKWKEAYTYFSKACTYLCLALLTAIQFVVGILGTEKDGIGLTVLMYTVAVSIMEYRDNTSEYKKRLEILKCEQSNFENQAREIRDIEFEDKILTNLENEGRIDKEKRKDIINSMKMD